MNAANSSSNSARVPAFSSGLLLVLSPMVMAYGILALYATSIPLIDDYWHLIAFAIEIKKTVGFEPKLVLLFTEQVGPYKLIFDHALIWLQLALWGRLNFPLMILLGNLTPLGIFYFLCKNIPVRRDNIIVLAPISLLLFNLNYAETVDWAVSGLQQPAVILFSIATLHFLVRSPRSIGNFAVACICGLVASLTYANGVLVWGVGLIYLVFTPERNRKLAAYVAVWLICFAAALFIYIRHYQGNAVTVHASIVQQVIFLISFCGGGFENMHHRPVPYISMLVGLVIIVVIAYALWSRYNRKNPFYFFSMTWVMLTAMVVANARVSSGLQLSLSSRYKIYCDLLLIFCYVFLFEHFFDSCGTPLTKKTRQQLLGGALVLTALVNVGGNIAGARFLRTRKMRAEAAMRRYQANPQSSSPMFLVEDALSPAEVQMESLSRQELNEARRLGIYTPPALSR